MRRHITVRQFWDWLVGAPEAERVMLSRLEVLEQASRARDQIIADLATEVNALRNQVAESSIVSGPARPAVQRLRTWGAFRAAMEHPTTVELKRD